MPGWFGGGMLKWFARDAEGWKDSLGMNSPVTHLGSRGGGMVSVTVDLNAKDSMC